MKFAVVALIGVAAAEKQACIQTVKLYKDAGCTQEAIMTTEVKKAQWSMLSGFKTACLDGEMSAMPTTQLDKCQTLTTTKGVQSGMYFSETMLEETKPAAKKDEKPAAETKPAAKTETKKAGAKFMAAGAAAVLAMAATQFWVIRWWLLKLWSYQPFEMKLALPC